MKALTDKIQSERDQARLIFSSKDSQIGKWKETAQQLNQENNGLQDILDRLLAENRDWREKIRMEKERHADQISSIVDRHVNTARTAIHKSVLKFDNPNNKGNAQCHGGDLLQCAEQISSSLSKLSSKSVPVLLEAVTTMAKPCDKLLLDVKGTGNQKLMKAAKELALEMRNLLDDLDQVDISKAMNLLSQLKMESLAFAQEEERQRLTSMELQSIRQQQLPALDSVSQRLRAALEKLKNANHSDLVVKVKKETKIGKNEENILIQKKKKGDG